MSEARSMDPTLVDLPIGIRAETSLADPDTCKFTVSRTLHPGGPFFFGTMERAAGSPLGERLFALPGVANVLIAESVVTIGKEPSASWSPLKAAIGRRSDAELSAAVQELLDKEVNRSIANHGGKISIVNIRQGTLFITMSGGCQGCASSQATLRQGFEVMVKRIAPEIVEIVDATDHAAGKKPFYPHAGQAR